MNNTFFSRKKLLNILLLIATIAVVVLTFYPAIPSVNGSGFLNVSKNNFSSSTKIKIGSYFTKDEAYISDNYDRYTLKVTLPENTETIAFRVPAVFSDVIVSINGEVVFNHDSKTDKLYPGPHLCIYTCKSTILNFELLLEKNSAAKTTIYTFPLASDDFILGSTTAVYNNHNRLALLANAMFIVFCSVGILNMLSSAFRKRAYYLSYFALFCFSLAVTTTFVNQFTVLHYVDIPLKAGLFISISAYIFRLYFFILYIHNMYKDYISSSVKNFFLIANSVCFALLFVSLNTNASIILRVVLLLTLLFITLSLCISFKKYVYTKDKPTLLFFICIFLYYIGTIMDSLYLLGKQQIPHVLLICCGILVLFEVFFVSFKYHSATYRVSKLSPLVKANLDKMQSNKSTYISTHIKPLYLYETLDSIDSYIGNDIDKVDKLVQAFSKYLRQALDFSIDPNNYSLKKELENCKAFAIILKQQHPRLHINIDYDKSLPDTSVPQLTILSLIDNATNYAFEETIQPTIDVKAVKDNDTIIVSVSDNGIGMRPEIIQHSLDMPQNDMSIGLYYINQQLISCCNTSLKIESSHSHGTTISFALHIMEREEEEYYA